MIVRSKTVSSTWTPVNTGERQVGKDRGEHPEPTGECAQGLASFPVFSQQQAL